MRNILQNYRQARSPQKQEPQSLLLVLLLSELIFSQYFSSTKNEKNKTNVINAATIPVKNKGLFTSAKLNFFFLSSEVVVLLTL